MFGGYCTLIATQIPLSFPLLDELQSVTEICSQFADKFLFKAGSFSKMTWIQVRYSDTSKVNLVRSKVQTPCRLPLTRGPLPSGRKVTVC